LEKCGIENGGEEMRINGENGRNVARGEEEIFQIFRRELSRLKLRRASSGR
jgi:hypothetical protein